MTLTECLRIARRNGATHYREGVVRIALNAMPADQGEWYFRRCDNADGRLGELLHWVDDGTVVLPVYADLQIGATK